MSKAYQNYLRSKMADDRLNALSVLAIESQLVKSLSYNDVIDAFAIRKARRKLL
jgi:hypothetical protein